MGYLHAILFISPLAMLVGPIIEHADERSHLETIILSKIIYKIGEEMFNISIIVVMIRWFRDQVSLPIVFAFHYTLMPLVACIWTYQNWETEFTVPAENEKHYTHYNAL